MKSVERSNGLDTALYKTTFTFFYFSTKRSVSTKVQCYVGNRLLLGIHTFETTDDSLQTIQYRLFRT